MKIEISKKHIWFMVITVGLLVIASLVISYAPIVYNVLPAQILPQGAGSGLDSDKVDALHASDLSAAGGGGVSCSSTTSGIVCCMPNAAGTALICNKYGSIAEATNAPTATWYAIGKVCNSKNCNADPTTAGALCLTRGSSIGSALRYLTGAGASACSQASGNPPSWADMTSCINIVAIECT